jgi:hypothetical protein
MAVVVLLKFQVVPAMWNAAFYGDFDVRAVPWFKDRIFIQVWSRIDTTFHGSETRTNVLMFFYDYRP